MDADVVVVGGGPGGSAAALQLARQGIDTLVVEKAEFPRFHIGESMTGAVGKLIRSLGLEDEMTRAGFPIKHGTKVFGTDGKNGFYVPVVDVAPDGSRDEEATTWQVRRSVFDEMMLEQARSAGARVVNGVAESPIVEGDAVRGVEISGVDGYESLGASAVIDASGQGCFLAKHALTSPKSRGAYDKQIAIFTHVEGADRGSGETADDTIILYKGPDHWSWFIPIDDEVVSIGVVVPSSYYRERGVDPVAFLQDEFRTLNPELAWRVADAEMVIEPRVIANYSYDIESFVGPGWLCVGDSHQFIDPVFSFGLHFAVHEGVRAAQATAEYLADSTRSLEPLTRYEAWARSGQEVIRDLLDGFWGRPLAFGYLVHAKHRDDFVDLFAGRVYDIDEPSPGLTALRKLTAEVRAERAASDEKGRVRVA